MSNKSFIDYENSQLTALERSFTPAQQRQYSEEVQYIRYLLKLLDQTESQKPTTKAEATQKKKDEKKIKDQVKFTFKQILNSYALSKSTDLTHNTIDDESIVDAKFSKASDKFYKGGKSAADDYLAEQGLDDWKINEELSTEHGLVLHNEKIGKTKIDKK